MTKRKVESEYDRLVAMGLMQNRKDGAVMTPEQRKERRAAQTRLMMEARRRAERILVLVHKNEFDALYQQEKAALADDPKYALPAL